MMNNLGCRLDLEGCLDIELNQQSIKLECQGQFIQLTFCSFKALRVFFAFYRRIKKGKIAGKIEDPLSSFSIHYYLCDFLIAESNPHLQTDWLAHLFKLPHTSLFPREILKYFLS